MPGPPDWEAWYAIFRCVRTTFLLLEAMSAERMDAYAEHIRQFAIRFGADCWDLVYTADVHMRSEQFERIRRRLHASPEHGYTDADPWNAVMAQAIKEDSFWTKEVITPATLRLAQARSIPAPSLPRASLAFTRKRRGTRASPGRRRERRRRRKTNPSTTDKSTPTTAGEWRCAQIGIRGVAGSHNRKAPVTRSARTNAICVWVLTRPRVAAMQSEMRRGERRTRQ